MIGQRQIEFRNEYRSRIIGWYDGYFHIAIIYAMGAAAFYDLLNHDKASVALDFRSPRDLDLLRHLLARADIVVESSRPRALQQLGIDSAAFCSAGSGSTWLCLTAHGGEPPKDGWIGFGDDTAVAAGLSTIMRRASGESLFCADAIADPLGGMHAALAGWWSSAAGCSPWGSPRASGSVWTT